MLASLCTCIIPLIFAWFWGIGTITLIFNWTRWSSAFLSNFVFSHMLISTKWRQYLVHSSFIQLTPTTLTVYGKGSPRQQLGGFELIPHHDSSSLLCFLFTKYCSQKIIEVTENPVCCWRGWELAQQLQLQLVRFPQNRLHLMPGMQLHMLVFIRMIWKWVATKKPSQGCS